jgi:hypothetical protein
MNWKLYCLVSGSQCDQFQYPASSDSSSISRAGILNAMVSYGSAATCGTLVSLHTGPIECTHNEILVVFVWRFPFLLPSTHEPPPWDHVALDLWQMHLYHHTFLSGIPIPNFCDPVPRPSNLQENLAVDGGLRWGDGELIFLHVTSRTSCEIRLMLLTLRVRKVRTLICVECETETTF